MLRSTLRASATSAQHRLEAPSGLAHPCRAAVCTETLYPGRSPGQGEALRNHVTLKGKWWSQQQPSESTEGTWGRGRNSSQHFGACASPQDVTVLPPPPADPLRSLRACKPSAQCFLLLSDSRGHFSCVSGDLTVSFNKQVKQTGMCQPPLKPLACTNSWYI